MSEESSQWTLGLQEKAAIRLLGSIPHKTFLAANNWKDGLVVKPHWCSVRGSCSSQLTTIWNFGFTGSDDALFRPEGTGGALTYTHYH